MAVKRLWIIECKYYKRGRSWQLSIHMPFLHKDAAEAIAVERQAANPGWQYRAVEFIRGGKS